jgi:hypothetical protein
MYKYAISCLPCQQKKDKSWEKFPQVTFGSAGLTVSRRSRRRRAVTMRDVENEERKYVPAKQRTREKIEEMLQSGAAREIGEALWSAAYYDPDWRWVQSQCLRFLTHADVGVRRNAVTCLGLIAVFHKKLDKDLVLPALQKAAEDPEVKSRAEDSLDDIRHTFELT